jgi:ferredoxin--NADP+ reductase
MRETLSAKRLNDQMVRMSLAAPALALKARPGQFLVVKIDEKGERIPLTVCRTNPSEGSVDIIFQIVGQTTKRLAALKKGEHVSDVLGPLGNPTHIDKYGHTVIVGGGVGVAEILPVTKALKEAGNEVSVIIGARSKDLLILKDELRQLSDNFYVATDDGSEGKRGFVTEVLRDLITAGRVDMVYAVGPVMMMKSVSELTGIHNIKTLVSLNANMVDGTGMCGSCRVTVGGKTKFTCVDGPEFDGHQVDWDEFLKRDRRFTEQEKVSLDHYNKRCKC